MGPKNIFYKSNIDIREYHSKNKSISKKLSVNDWKKQSEKLLMELNQVFEDTNKEIKAKNGEYLEVIGVENEELKVKSLKDDRLKVRVLKTEKIIENSEDERKSKNYQKALVYLPENNKDFLKKKIETYKKNSGEKQATLINSILKIKKPSLESFWSGEISEIPNEKEKWCEFWIDKNREIETLIEKIRNFGIEVREKFLKFEERDVILCKVDKNKILKIINEIEGVCEIKLKSDFLIETFLDIEDREAQFDWIKNLKERIRFKDENNTSILLIDSGVNDEHPLLKDFVKNCNGANKDDIYDKKGHGTRMAGLALYKDLAVALEKEDEVEINHTLQSHKIFYENFENKDLYGSMTAEAILDSFDLLNQINCMAIASDENINNGAPTSWSATIDELCFGDYTKPEGRIFCLSAGNINNIQANEIGYPTLNEISCIEDPGQAWNALTIGGYTTKYLNDSEYKIVAEPFSLSPFSKTSCLWNSKGNYKLIKPEVLFEAGNKIIDSQEYYSHENLSLLSTNAKIQNNYFNFFAGTSAATALAANFCAKLVDKYPEAWPQTIRGLVVHSAEWTDQMKNQFLKDNSKTSYGNLLRNCGYGVPNLDRALGLLKNSANLIIESEIKPFKLTKEVTYNELHIHELPWPKDILNHYSDKKFKIKVTLSYFIEPNPGNFKGIYDYQSYGLRFEFCGNRTKEELIRKVSKVDNISYKDSNSDNWLYGPVNRNVGSIHSDIWEGNGADFAEARYILIHPVSGWWKQKKKAGRYRKKIKYSLIVSITSEKEEIDLYTPIYNSIQNLVKNKNLIEIKSK